jgi:imidazolonepropionase-like amidohydrolase
VIQPPRPAWSRRPCRLWAVALLLAGTAAPAFAAPEAGAPDTSLVLAGGRYFDARAGVLRPNGFIVSRGGRIVAIHPPSDRWTPPAGARVVSAEGRTILPGLIDAHVHLTLAGDPLANARATLRAGFTTVADLGSAADAGLRLRDSLAAGRAPGPGVIAAGSWIGARGGVCEFGGATVSSAAEAGARARSDLAAGADLLKVCVTGWPAEAVAHPDSVQFGGPMLSAVMEAGAGAKRPVYAHAIGRAGALLAAGTGVRALAHTPIVDSAGAARLRATGVRVISTLATLTAGETGPAVLASFRLLHGAGVPIVLGTDAGVLAHGENAKELVALVEAGLSPLEALRAATVSAADLLGVAGLGAIEVGAPADFVLVEGDPLADVRVVLRPALVVKGGLAVE